jgi:transposase
MGRLSAYAKNRILKLRFKKNKRIIHIVDILKRDDNIKVSRQAVSTFLKKYLETNSIYDKPRTGRKRKLTQEEIQLIGQVTRLNRDITARAIKEYLNLNVSTYTILRATKLFEWNKINPNSNDSKKAAALERQKETTDGKRRRSNSASSTGKKPKRKPNANDGNESASVVPHSDDNDHDLSATGNPNESLVSLNDNLTENESDINEIERIQEKLLLNSKESKQQNESSDGVTSPKPATKPPRHTVNSIPGNLFIKWNIFLVRKKNIQL